MDRVPKGNLNVYEALFKGLQINFKHVKLVDFVNEIKNKEYIIQKYLRINKILDNRSAELLRQMKVLCDLGVRANTCVAIYVTTITYNFTVNINTISATK